MKNMKNWIGFARRAALFIVAVGGGTPAVLAQTGGRAASPAAPHETASLSALDGRVPASLRAPLTALADSVARAGLPVGPLIDKALEGVSKGATPPAILKVVRAIAANLGVARRALGDGASDDELTSAVAALRAGVSPDVLTGIRRSLPGRSLVVPLSVLSSLIAQRVPVPSATLAVVQQAKGEDDARLLAFSRVVGQGIAAGVPPVAAVQEQTSAMGAHSPRGPTAPIPHPPQKP